MSQRQTQRGSGRKSRGDGKKKTVRFASEEPTRVQSVSTTGNGRTKQPQQKKRRVKEPKEENDHACTHECNHGSSNVKKIESMHDPKRMGSRKLTVSNEDFDRKDKRGASLAFREKFNQYLDSRTEKDDLNLDFVRNAAPEDLYSRFEDDMSDDEKLAHTVFEENVDATVEKYKKLFQRHPRETISTVEQRKKMEMESRREGTFTVRDEEEGIIEELNNDRGNEVEVERTVFVLNVPTPGSASALMAKHFSRLEINTNPYPFYFAWCENFPTSSGPPRHVRRKPITFVVCVQFNHNVKTLGEALRTFKNFFTSTKYLTLNMFFNGIKPCDVLYKLPEPKTTTKSAPKTQSETIGRSVNSLAFGRSTSNFENANTRPKENVDGRRGKKTSKKDANDFIGGSKSKEEEEEEEEYDDDPTLIIEAAKMDSIKILNELIEKGSGFKVKRTCNPIKNEMKPDFTTAAITDDADTVSDLSCSIFEKSYLAEDLDMLLYVYYNIDLTTRKMTIDKVFYVLINLR